MATNEPASPVLADPNPEPRPQPAERALVPLRLALPKGRTQANVTALLAAAGIDVEGGARGYRPNVTLPACEAKLLKPRSVVEMLSRGSRDLGFAGADWVSELDADVVEVLDTGLDPVRIVAAAPRELLASGCLPDRPLVIATEYVALTARWAEARGLDARVLETRGATEVFPPEDADLIVDNTATGATLRANGLVVVEEVARSSTRLYASRAALADPPRAARIEELRLLCASVLEARRRVMVEVNVAQDDLEGLVASIPCMREPTVAWLSDRSGYAVKAAVPRVELPLLVPALKARGGTDIVVSAISQLVP